MKFGIPISLLLHATLISGGLFVFKGTPKLPDEQRIIPIDIIDVSSETNIRATVKRPEVEPKVEPEIDVPAVQDVPDVPPIVADPQTDTAQDAAIIPDEPTPEPKDTVEDVTEPAPVTDGEPETKEDDAVDEAPSFNLDDLSALIDRSREEEPAANQQRILQSEETLYAFADVARSGAGAQDGLSLSETDALRAAMYKCWRIPVDAKDPESLIIPVDVKLHRDGHVASVRLKNSLAINNSSNPYMKIAAENALRAISKCAPYDFLPADRYESWKQMILTFRPVLSQ